MANSSRQGREKRSKAASDRIDSVHVSWFNDDQFNKFNAACKNRKLIIERLFDQVLLEMMNFRFMDDLVDWGWWKLIDNTHRVRPNAVRAFYFFGNNIAYDRTGGEIEGGTSSDNFISTVLGSKFTVNKNIINRQLGFRATGDTHIPTNFNYVEACRVVYRDNDIDAFVDDVKRLDAHTRILHLMVCQCLNLRQGSFTNISKEDMYFMSKIILKYPPNLGAFITRRMVRGLGWSKSKDNNYRLPYGKMASLLVDCKCRMPTYELAANTVTLKKLNKAALHKMNFVLNEETYEWVKKLAPREEVAENVNEEPNAALQDRNDVGFAAMQARLDAGLAGIHARLDDMEVQIWEIKESLAAEDEDDNDDAMSP